MTPDHDWLIPLRVLREQFQKAAQRHTDLQCGVVRVTSNAECNDWVESKAKEARLALASFYVKALTQSKRVGEDRRSCEWEMFFLMGHKTAVKTYIDLARQGGRLLPQPLNQQLSVQPVNQMESEEMIEPFVHPQHTAYLRWSHLVFLTLPTFGPNLIQHSLGSQRCVWLNLSPFIASVCVADRMMIKPQPAQGPSSLPTNGKLAQLINLIDREPEGGRKKKDLALSIARSAKHAETLLREERSWRAKKRKTELPAEE